MLRQRYQHNYPLIWTFANAVEVCRDLEGEYFCQQGKATKNKGIRSTQYVIPGHSIKVESLTFADCQIVEATSQAR